jgi:hypothetical protein
MGARAAARRRAASKSTRKRKNPSATQTEGTVEHSTPAPGDREQASTLTDEQPDQPDQPSKLNSLGQEKVQAAPTAGPSQITQGTK